MILLVTSSLFFYSPFFAGFTPPDVDILPSNWYRFVLSLVEIARLNFPTQNSQNNHHFWFIHSLLSVFFGYFNLEVFESLFQSLFDEFSLCSRIRLSKTDYFLPIRLIFKIMETSQNVILMSRIRKLAHSLNAHSLNDDWTQTKTYSLHKKDFRTYLYLLLNSLFETIQSNFLKLS